MLIKKFSFSQLVWAFLLVVLFNFSFVHLAHAEPPDELDYHETFVRAKVLQIVSENIRDYGMSKSYEEQLKVQLLEGQEKEKVITIYYTSGATFGIKQKINKNALVVVNSKPSLSGKTNYYLYQPYRLTTFWWILGIFLVLILLIIGKKGIGAIIGLTISLAIILFYIVPQILAGRDPLTVCICGSIVILFVTTYVAHGVSLTTTTALVSTSLALIFSGLFSALCINLLYLTGLGDQNSYGLQLATMHQINPAGLLLGGIIIGTLGALNDVTTTQAITIFTLAKEHPKQKLSRLFKNAMHIGREHIISMINTLILAYAGSSLMIFLFFSYNPLKLPWWLLLNDQLTMEEIVRAIAGSAGLILAVPITTLLASYIALNRKRLSQFRIEFH